MTVIRESVIEKTISTLLLQSEIAGCVPNASPAFAHTILQQYQIVNTTAEEMEIGRHKEGGRKVNTLCIFLQDFGKILHT